jgi:hypothetical protein
MRKSAGARIGICQGREKKANSCCERYRGQWQTDVTRALLAFGFLDDPFEPGDVGDPEVTALAPQ